MDIIINNSSNQPIYEQIIAQLKEKIMLGELVEGDELPSLRFLAKELRISVITTKRAYEELARDGFIISVPGKGCYVSKKNITLEKKTQQKEIEIILRKAIALAKTSDTTLEALEQRLTHLYKEAENE